MSMNFKNKTILITGGSSGIGLACARSFAELGAKLILIARREDKLKILASELKKEYSTETLILGLDVSDRLSVEQKLKNLPEAWLSIDVLVNSAGLALGREKTQEGSLDDWNTMIDVNIKGLLNVTHVLLPRMVQIDRGHVINIGSISGRQTYVGGAVYCATKHAVKAFSDALRCDLNGTQVRVSCVDPGMVETEFSLVRFKGNSDRSEEVYAGFEALRAEDIADAVVYCASRPPRVTIQDMLVMPTAQASVTLLHRTDSK